MKLEKSCGAIVFDGSNVLLVVQKAGHTTFPKGHVEKGETEAETAKREVLEETGIMIEVDTDYRYTTEYSPSEGIRKTVVFFLGTKISGDLHKQETEISQVMWTHKDRVIELLTYEDTKQIFKQLLMDVDSKKKS